MCSLPRLAAQPAALISLERIKSTAKSLLPDERVRGVLESQLKLARGYPILQGGDIIITWILQYRLMG